MTDRPTDAADGPGPTDPTYFETLSVGETRTTAERTITAADVAEFAALSGDDNSIHTDPETARAAGFDDRIVPGALVFAVATGLLWQSRSPAERDAFVALYGLDRVRFVAPVFVGDAVTVESTVAALEPRDHEVASGVVRYETVVCNREDDTVLACELLSLVR